MKKAMVTMMLLAGGLFAAPHLAVGIGIGVGAPVAVVRPVCPGPGYVWMDGYFAPNGVFVAGYWAPPVVRIAPVVGIGPMVRIAPVARFAARPVFHGYEHFRR